MTLRYLMSACGPGPTGPA